MRKLAVSAALALAFVPNAFAGPAPNAADRSQAQKDCRALRTSMGTATFRLTYGTAQAKRANAFGRCVRQWSREEHENRHEAVAACAAEREADEDAFAEKYGVGPKNRGAFGQCVAAARRAESQDDRRDTMNAAQMCKAERGDPAFASSHDNKTFAEFYGTNENDRNAFGKCVSTKAKAQNDDA